MPSRAVEPSEMETRSRMLKGTDTTHLFLRSPLHKGRAGPRPEATDPPMSVTDHRSPHPLSVRGRRRRGEHHPAGTYDCDHGLSGRRHDDRIDSIGAGRAPPRRVARGGGDPGPAGRGRGPQRGRPGAAISEGSASSSRPSRRDARPDIRSARAVERVTVTACRVSRSATHRGGQRRHRTSFEGTCGVRSAETPGARWLYAESCMQTASAIASTSGRSPTRNSESTSDGSPERSRCS